jgi:hypothetical protein
MPLLRSIAAVIAPLLFAAPALRGTDVSPAVAERYSVTGVAPRPIDSGFTLLDPAWLLPPIESLDAAAHAGGSAARADALLREDAILGLGSRPVRSAGGPLAYSLSDALTAQLRYRRSQMFRFSRSQTVRDDPSSGFSTQADRDVVDLNMSWRLAGSTVGLGYQLQSSTHGLAGVANDAGLARFLPGSAQATHSLSLGFTREWGAAPPPEVHVETPLVLDDPFLAASLLPDVTPQAAVEATATP